MTRYTGLYGYLLGTWFCEVTPRSLVWWRRRELYLYCNLLINIRLLSLEISLCDAKRTHGKDTLLV